MKVTSYYIIHNKIFIPESFEKKKKNWIVDMEFIHVNYGVILQFDK